VRLIVVTEVPVPLYTSLSPDEPNPDVPASGAEGKLLFAEGMDE
jgi:hypothetical protein